MARITSPISRRKDHGAVHLSRSQADEARLDLIAFGAETAAVDGLAADLSSSGTAD
jgi:hypothetical protein